jgi:hypothetical protein
MKEHLQFAIVCKTSLSRFLFANSLNAFCILFFTPCNTFLFYLSRTLFFVIKGTVSRDFDSVIFIFITLPYDINFD